jgi:hypothetical protein
MQLGNSRLCLHAVALPPVFKKYVYLQKIDLIIFMGRGRSFENCSFEFLSKTG